MWLGSAIAGLDRGRPLMQQSEALQLLKAGQNVFLTGAPGSGKTYVLTKFVTWARDRGKRVAVTASTGIAATHINGRTIHAWSGIGIHKYLTPQLLTSIRRQRKKKICDADVLVIDEISMISASMFDMVDEVCRKVRRNSQPFGGLQVVLSGDFYQLPPVTRSGAGNGFEDPQLDESRRAYLDVGRNPDGFAPQSFVWEHMGLRVCYLSEQHRQDKGALLDVLTDIRAGAVTQADRDALATRLGKTPGDDEVAVRFFPTNKKADEVNEGKLGELDGDEHVYDSIATGSVRMLEVLERNVLAPSHLVLKKGAAVMALRNDPSNNFVNGSLGVVTGFFKGKGEEQAPIVEFDNGNTLVMGRAEWQMTDGDTTVASIRQYPLRCAWAITIHKSQGMTLDSAQMDLRRVFTPGMGYVALSRVESLDGIYLDGLSDRAFDVSAEAIALDKLLRAESAKNVAQLRQKGIDSFKTDPATLF